MAKGNGRIVYVVTMYRWGDRECHSYVLGVYSTKTKALKAGESEQEYRGGTKYYPEVLEIRVDGGRPFDTQGWHKPINKLGCHPAFQKMTAPAAGE